MIATNSEFEFVPSPEHGSSSNSQPSSEPVESAANSTDLATDRLQTTGQNLNLAVSQTSGFKRWQRSLHLIDGDSQAQSSPPAETTNADDVSRYLRETLETLAY